MRQIAKPIQSEFSAQNFYYSHNTCWEGGIEKSTKKGDTHHFFVFDPILAWSKPRMVNENDLFLKWE
jgi:hypothetical protein